MEEADPEVQFHVMAAERLARIGEYRDALEQYLEAARLTEDEEMAQQVARLAARMGEWEMALAGSERWLELDPDSLDARQIRILAWLNTGHVEEAEAGLRTLLSDHEDRREGWRRATVLLSATESEALALDVMDRLIADSDDAESVDVLHSQSVLLWQLGDTERALELAQKATEGNGERRHHVWVAQLAAELEDLELALQSYREAREGAPDDVSLALAEAEVLRQLERSEEALVMLEDMPADGEILYTRGLYLAYLDKNDAAKAEWQRLAAIDDPAEPYRHAFLTGRLAEMLELDEEALEWYGRVDGGPAQERARLRRGVVKARVGDLPAARALFAEVRQSDDHDMAEQAWLVEAEFLRKAEDYEEAINVLGQALRETPNHIEMLYARGLMAVYADDLELAEQDFRRIIQIDGDNAMALNALGYTLTDRTDRHQEALRLIRRALELEPDEPAILDSMGWVYFRLDQPQRALPYLERAFEGEDNPEIAAHLIEVLWTLDRTDEALELRDRAIDEWPDDNYLVDTLKRLELMP
ncbi:tetratricopeptide repeat protein [Wenzhouxiangella sp. AB-CW3]|uniref:tetratricopeptide repeat protein n=1 Tax=Wenzhouxiangella sp. AB-CW3 TaxID=2771012 RepID=UPI00168B45D3|nr:tetratricopeptide repeat protein [Wenzhouxiangella sp. AB-CW3]QOC23885.1 tetratricopeptide repeat protein [Wenzhouxiangella sp. AB-CW3]